MLLVIGEALRAIGLPGQIVSVAVAAVGLWHFRSALQALATIGTVIKIVGGFGFVLVLAWAGFIPGVDFAVATDRLAAAAGDAIELARSLVEVGL